MTQFVFKADLNKKFAATCFDETSERANLKDVLKSLNQLEQAQVAIRLGNDGDKFCRVETPMYTILVKGCPDREPGMYSLDILGNATIVEETKRTMTQQEVETAGLNWDWYTKAPQVRQIIHWTNEAGSNTSAEDFLKALLSR